MVARAGAPHTACMMNAHSPTAGPALRAFIVEDSPLIRENLIATLEEMTPVRVVGTAEDEASAVEALNAAPGQVDIAIIDIFLARGSGLGVLEALRKAGHPAERVVLTNYATADMRQRCLALGAARVFDKSGEIEALLAHCSRRAAGQPADVPERPPGSPVPHPPGPLRALG